MKLTADDLERGEYVRNKKTGVRGDVMVIYRDRPYIRVIRHPSDLQAGHNMWQLWPIDDVEKML